LNSGLELRRRPIRTIDLGNGQLMASEGRPGECVRMLDSSTWLTQKGDPDDAVLRVVGICAVGSGAARAGGLVAWHDSC